MAFEFLDFNYTAINRWTESQRDMGIAIVKKGILRNTPVTRVYNQLKVQGIGMRKTDMLKDLRRAYITERSVSYPAYERAKWFAENMETLRLRTEHKTFKEALDLHAELKERTRQAEIEGRAKEAIEEQDYDPRSPEPITTEEWY